MTTTNDITTVSDDRELKGRHRAMWALGDYPAVARDVIPSLGPVVVEAARIGPGDRVLDVAAGSGNAAVPAALTGAHVVASDLTPELLAAGRDAAARAGVELEWREADAEALPFEDASFDVVISVVGVMFAPHHQVAADELVRVCRPAGRIALVSWTPEGFIGQMFATMKPYAAPPPPGASPPLLWGTEAHVRELLGDRVTDVVAERRLLEVAGFADGAAFRDFFKATYGPTIAAYRGIAAEPERVAALDRDLAALGDRWDRGTRGSGHAVTDWEYLLLTCRRR
jgi:SAM-dependent methyltransferase